MGQELASGRSGTASVLAASAKAGCDLDIFHKDVERPTGIWFNELLECDDGEIVFRHACKIGLEGIVSKRKDVPLPAPRIEVAIDVWPVVRSLRSCSIA